MRVGSGGFVRDLGTTAIPDGTVSVPSIRFAQDQDTGFYRPGANQVGMALGGVAAFVFAANTITVPAGLGVTTAGAVTFTVAEQAAAFRISTANASLFTIDSRDNVTGVTTYQFATDVISFASAAANAYSTVAIPADTIVQTGVTTITALAGLTLNVGAKTISNTSAGLTITTASNVIIGGVEPTGNATITTAVALDLPTFAANGTTAAGIRVAAPTGATRNFALNIVSGALGLNSAAQTAGDVLTSGGDNAIPIWTAPGALGVRWSSLTAPTAALSLTMPATNETTFTIASTTQRGFTWASSTLTSGGLLTASITGSSAVATAASNGSVMTLSSTTTGFTAATQSLLGIYSSGANTNNGVTVTGATISVTNTNGVSGTNVALTLTASGATTANTALNVTAGTSIFAGLITGTAGLTITGAAINLNVSSNFATSINTGTSTGAVSIGNTAAGAISLTSAAAITLQAAAQASAFVLSTSAATYLTIDTRGNTSGVLSYQFLHAAISFASAAGSAYSTVAIPADTLTLTGGIGVTALDGLGLLIGSPTITSTSATTVTDASALFITAPTAAGSVTITNNWAIQTAGHIGPDLDNTYNLGNASFRWANIYATVANFGDVGFANGWRLTEGDKIGLDPDQMYFVSADGRRYRFVLEEVA